MNKAFCTFFIVSLFMLSTFSQDFNPCTYLWYDSPALEWEEALPVGNGRLGAMVFGKSGEERIQLNDGSTWRLLLPAWNTA